MSEIKLKITGMTCQHCVKAATKALEDVSGVESAAVSLEPGGAVVRGQADPNALIEAVREEGYEAQVEE